MFEYLNYLIGDQSFPIFSSRFPFSQLTSKLTETLVSEDLFTSLKLSFLNLEPIFLSFLLNLAQCLHKHLQNK